MLLLHVIISVGVTSLTYVCSNFRDLLAIELGQSRQRKFLKFDHALKIKSIVSRQKRNQGTQDTDSGTISISLKLKRAHD